MKDRRVSSDPSRAAKSSSWVIRLVALGCLSVIILTAVSFLIPDAYFLDHLWPLVRDHYAIGTASAQRREQLFLAIIGKGRWIALLMGILGVAIMILWSWLVTRSNLPEQQEAPIALLVDDAPPAGRQHWMILGAICSLALVLRLLLLHQSLWMDELTAVVSFMKHRSLWEAITHSTAASHFLYSLLGRLSIAVLGESEVTIRLPALLFGLLGIGLAYHLASRLFDRQVGLVAAFLMTVSPTHFFFSQSARGYTALMVFAVLSVLFFFRSLERPDHRQWIWYSAVTFLGFAVHQFMLWVVVCQFLLVGLMIGKELYTGQTAVLITKRWVDHFFLCLLIVGMATLLLYGLLAPRSLAGLFLSPRGRGTSGLFSSLIGIFSSGRGSGLAGWLYLGLAVTGFGFGFGKRPMPLLLLGLIIVVPPIIMLAPSTTYLAARFFLFALPFYLILVAAGVNVVGTLVGRLRSPAVVAGCLALGALQIPPIRYQVQHEWQSFRRAGELLTQVASPDTAICAIGIGSQNLGYYVGNGQLIIPRRWEQFRALVQEKQTVYCALAYRPRAAEFAEHRRIYQYLQQHAVEVKTIPSQKPIEIFILRSEASPTRDH